MSSLLSFEQIVRIVGLMAGLGVRRVRITGGEPLVRRHLPQLVASLNAIEALEEVVMTTNAYLLERDADALWDAGLREVTVSVDTLEADRFFEITRGGDLDVVMRGIAAAAARGMSVKINSVLMRGFNDDVVPMVQWALDHGYLLRFIEFMPIGEGTVWQEVGGAGVIRAEEMRAMLSEHWELRSLGRNEAAGPSQYYELDDSGQRIGIIGAVTECFCSACNRVRITPQGGFRSCLADDREVSLRDLIMNGGSDADLEQMIRQALGDKRESHRFDIEGGAVTRKNMVAIGG